MIEFIELKNWKTHQHTMLNFAKGTNVLVGQMGVGKSSVMDAISYALFGTFPALQHRRVGVNDIIKNVPVQESYAEVKLGLSLDGNEYIIERRLELAGGATAKISKNGSIMQSQPQRVNEYIEGLLKMDYDLFSRAIYSEQNNLDYFLELRSSERKDVIDELLGLDKFAIAEDNVTSLINRIKDLASQQEANAANFDIKKLNEQLSVAKDELAKLKKDSEELISKRLEHTEKLKKVEKELKELQEKNAKKISLEKELKGLESTLSFDEREIKKIEEMGLKPEELEPKIGSVSNELERLKAELKKAEQQELEESRAVARLENELRKLGEQIKERDSLIEKMKLKDIDNYAKAKDEKEEQIEKLEKELASAKSRKEEMGKYIEDLSKHISKCPVCERELSEELRIKLLESKKKILSESEDEIKRISALIENERAEFKKLSEEFNAMLVANEKLKGYAGIDESFAKSKDELELRKKSEKEASANKEKLSIEVNELSAELVKLKESRKEAENLSKYKSEAQKLREAINAKKAEIDELSKSVNDKLIEEKQKEYTSISAMLSSIDASIKANEKAVNEKIKEINDKSEMLTHVEGIIRDAEQKKHAAEELMRFKNALSETQGALRSRLIDSINHIMSELWPELYPYGDYVDIRLNAGKDDYALEVKIIRNGVQEWRPVENIASGGERSIACLAMRVAFALVLVPNLKWLILDEPTHNIDEQGIAKFIHIFNETLPRIIDQIFLITHDETLKQASSSKTYVLSRDKAAHGGTVVEEL